MSTHQEDQKLSSLTIRSVEPNELSALLTLIRELAQYESLEHTLTVDEEALGELLFGPRPVAGAMLSRLDGQAVGFAVYFENLSTFLGARGLYLEDVYVRPDFRNQGIGLALLREVAREALRRNARFLDWRVLDWNTSAIDFYRRLGAEPLPQWIPFRLGPTDLEKLA
jgi:GNAT superfamily N-acetyltransferase